MTARSGWPTSERAGVRRKLKTSALAYRDRLLAYQQLAANQLKFASSLVEPPRVWARNVDPRDAQAA